MSATADAREQVAEELHSAVGELMRAQRRLRSSDPRRPGAIPYAQVRALILLDAEGEATAGELARATDLTPGSVTAMLDQLEGQGIVARRRSERDRRLVVVTLTPAGAELLARKRAAWRRGWEEAVTDLSDQQLRDAADVIRRVAEMFDRF